MIPEFVPHAVRSPWPANAIDANTAYERAFQVIFYHLLPGGWLTLLLKIYGSAGALALFFTRAQAPQGPEEEVEPHG